MGTNKVDGFVGFDTAVFRGAVANFRFTESRTQMTVERTRRHRYAHRH